MSEAVRGVPGPRVGGQGAGGHGVTDQGAGGQGARAAGAPGRGAHRSRTADVNAQVEALEQALAVAGDRLPTDVRRRVAQAVAGVRERLARGIDHTLVALVGGTGSGKSSLFNALSGLPLADVGVRRPTTSQVTACVWGGSGERLLDWLGVAIDRRFQRESVLDGEAQADLRGLVLLDLPDHDSVDAGHREVVDRLLPVVDLLVWVVDPQKYADDALHSGYLRHLTGHDGAMVVVLNQVDTVPAPVRGRVVADLQRLLTEDGLVGVPVLATSAADGTGVPELRATLARCVAGPSVSAVRAGAEAAAAGRVLATGVAPVEPGPGALPTAAVVDTLADATGLPAIAAATERSTRGVRGAAASVPAFRPVWPDTAELARTRWLADVGGGLPQPWRQDLGRRVASAQGLRDAVAGALTAVPVPARASTAGRVLAGVAVLAAVAAVLVGAVLLAGAVLDSPAPDRLVESGLTPALAAALAVVGAVLWVLAAVVRHRAGRRRAATVLAEGRGALDAVVTTQLVRPTRDLLAEHRTVRELAAAAAAGSPGGPSSVAGSPAVPGAVAGAPTDARRGGPVHAAGPPAAPPGPPSPGDRTGSTSTG